MRNLKSAFRRIVNKDGDRHPTPVATERLEPLLPKWVDRSAHESRILTLAVAQFEEARRDGRRAEAFIQAVVACEYVAGTASLPGHPGKPATQQIADAWFNKAALYWKAAVVREEWAPERDRYVRAAKNCLQVALSNPEFVRSRYEKLHAAISR